MALGRTILSRGVDEHFVEYLLETRYHDGVTCQFVELRIGDTRSDDAVNIAFGNVHETEAFARREFANPVFYDGKIVVLPL